MKPQDLMPVALFREQVRALYGDELTVAAYLRRLETLTGMSKSGLEKLWFGIHPVPRPIQNLLALAIVMRSERLDFEAAVAPEGRP